MNFILTFHGTNIYYFSSILWINYFVVVYYSVSILALLLFLAKENVFTIICFSIINIYPWTNQSQPGTGWTGIQILLFFSLLWNILNMFVKYKDQLRKFFFWKILYIFIQEDEISIHLVKFYCFIVMKGTHIFICWYIF